MTKFVGKISPRLAIDPFRVLQIHRMLSCAGADRLQSGMGVHLGSIKEEVQEWWPLAGFFCLFVVKTTMSIMLRKLFDVLSLSSLAVRSVGARLYKFQRALIIWKYKVETGWSQMELMLSFLGTMGNLTCCFSAWKSILAL